jgi:hypothetical protein
MKRGIVNVNSKSTISDYEKLGLSQESIDLLRYEAGGVGGLLSRIAKGAGSIYDAIVAGLRRKPAGTAPTPQQPFFRPPEAAHQQSDENLAAAEQAGAILQQQQRDALNAHVLDYLRRSPQTGAGGTLAQGRAYPMRIGGQHSAETSAQLSGECSDAGRRLEECKHSDHQRTHSRGERL